MTSGADAPLVTVVVPARDEELDIERCLQAIAAQSYPHDRIEVIVIDGASTDRTASVAAAWLAGHRFACGRVVSNVGGSTPSNLNVGLHHAAGDILVRIDARSIVPPGYIARMVHLLTERKDVAVVGGAQTALPRSRATLDQSVARALNNRLAMGMARYRRSAVSGPAETVYLGAFRTADLRSVGGWDERFPTNQDFELNRRMTARGGVWFEPIEVGYLPRASLRSLWSQYVRFGSWKVRYWRITGDRPQRRQQILLAAPVMAASAVAMLGRTSRGRRVITVGSVAGLLALDSAGQRRPAGLRVRIGASMVMPVVWGGWTWGVWREIARKRDG